MERSPAVAWTEVVDLKTGRARYSYIGPQAEQILGYTAKELIDEPGHFTRMVHPDDLRRVKERSDEAERSLTVWEDEFRVVTRDGTVRILHATARPGPVDPIAETVTWFGVSVDVTAVRVPEAKPQRTSAER